MFGETDLKKILETLEPGLNEGEFVFCPVESLEKVLAMVNLELILFFFKEGEVYTRQHFMTTFLLGLRMPIEPLKYWTIYLRAAGGIMFEFVRVKF